MINLGGSEGAKRPIDRYLIRREGGTVEDWAQRSRRPQSDRPVWREARGEASEQGLPTGRRPRSGRYLGRRPSGRYLI